MYLKSIKAIIMKTKLHLFTKSLLLVAVFLSFSNFAALAGDPIKNYTVELECTITGTSVNPIIVASSQSQFYAWRVSTTEVLPIYWSPGHTLLPSLSLASVGVTLQVGTPFILRVEFTNGNSAVTYINGVLIGTTSAHAAMDFTYHPNLFGFKANVQAELGVYDNIEISTTQNGPKEILYSEDFSGTESPFSDGIIENGKLKHTAGTAWYIAPPDPNAIRNYTVQLECTITGTDVNPAIVASSQTKAYGWRVSTTSVLPIFWNGGPGGYTLLPAIAIPAGVNLQIGTPFILRVEISGGNSAVTYINDVLIGTTTSIPAMDFTYNPGLFGFIANNAGEAGTFDDILITSSQSGSLVTLYDQKFSKSKNPFSGGSIVGGKLKTSAGWIWQLPDTGEEEIEKYTIEMDFEIENAGFGPIFGAKSTTSFFMWQIGFDNGGNTLFRPHYWDGGAGNLIETKDITATINIIPGTTHTLRIEVDGEKASTYIDDILIDSERANPLGGIYGYGNIGLGFRSDLGLTGATEKSYCDNIKVSAEVEGVTVTDYFTEDFSNPFCYAITSSDPSGLVKNGRLYLEGVNGSRYSWQQKNPFTLTSHSGTGLTFSGNWDAAKFDEILTTESIVKSGITSINLKAVAKFTPANKPVGFNDNCLIYLYSDSPVTATNFVKIDADGGATANKIELTDGVPFNNSVEFKSSNITFSRTGLTANELNAIYLPFGITMPAGMDAYSFTEIAGTKAKFTKVANGAALSANTPYLFKHNAANLQLAVASETTIGVTAAPQVNANSFIGTYSNVTPTDDYYTCSNTTFTKGSGNAVSPFQAYLQTSLVSVPGAPASYTIELVDDMTTNMNYSTIDNLVIIPVTNGFEVIAAQPQQLKLYSIDGRLVRSIQLTEGTNYVNGLSSGLYLLNNKKVIVK